MHIEERRVKGVVILDVKGPLALDESGYVLHEKIRALIQQGKKKMLLNLAECPYMDSSGLREVIATYTTVSRNGAKLKILHLTVGIKEVLVTTKLLAVFEAYDSEREAIRSFAR